MQDIKTRLSTLRVFVMFNMVFADIVRLPESRNPGGNHGDASHFGNAVGLLRPAGHPDRHDRPAPASGTRYQSLGEHSRRRNNHPVRDRRREHERFLSVLFFAAVEVACMATIMWSAWKWSEDQ